MTIWVASGNTTERALIVAALEEEGLEARGLESHAELLAALAHGPPPEVLLLDVGALDLTRENWVNITRLAPSAGTVLVCGSTTEMLPANLVLRRPISIGELVSKIKPITGGIQ
jgi:CheY-like chemotaxis protein